MAEEVVGSFPYREWAHEIQNALSGKGIAAEVAYAGPRAYPVYVAGKDYERAGEVLEQVGYFSCPVSSGRAGLGSILDWLPQEALDEGDYLDNVKKVMEEVVLELSEQHAAEAWSGSVPDYDDEKNPTWAIAKFGDSAAVNGDLILVGPIPDPPPGFVLTDEGGDIPTTEEEIDKATVFRVVSKKFPNTQEPLLPYAMAKAWDQLYGKSNLTYVNVSGDSEIYRKRDKGYEE